MPENHTSMPAGENSNSAIFLPASVIIGALILSATLFVVGSDLGSKVSGLDATISGIGSAPSGNTGTVAGTVPQDNTAPSPPPVIDMQALSTGYPTEGSASAKVTIVEFSDFQCPFCASFYNASLSQIRTNYIDTGKVKLVYRHFPLSFHPEAQKAAEAAECAEEQGKFWEMHDKLFENSSSLSVANEKQWAKDLGLDSAKFNTCLDSGKTASAVQKDAADGAAAGVSGTPTFFINGKEIVGAQPYAVFKAAINAELEK